MDYLLNIEIVYYIFRSYSLLHIHKKNKIKPNCLRYFFFFLDKCLHRQYSNIFEEGKEIYPPLYLFPGHWCTHQSWTNILIDSSHGTVHHIWLKPSLCKLIANIENDFPQNWFKYILFLLNFWKHKFIQVINVNLQYKPIECHFLKSGRNLDTNFLGTLHTKWCKSFAE